MNGKPSIPLVLAAVLSMAAHAKEGKNWVKARQKMRQAIAERGQNTTSPSGADTLMYARMLLSRVLLQTSYEPNSTYRYELVYSRHTYRTSTYRTSMKSITLMYNISADMLEGTGGSMHDIHMHVHLMHDSQQTRHETITFTVLTALIMCCKEAGFTHENCSAC